MKTTEIVGYKRADLGTKESRRLRADGNVPCVLYGGEEIIHFHSPMYLFKDLIYTPDAFVVNLNVEGVEKQCILQDSQFHPVSDMMLHADFLEIKEGEPVAIELPVSLKGSSPGVQAGGQVYIKNKKLKVKGVPSQLPAYIEVDISDLELGSSVRVQDVTPEGYEFLTKPQVSIVQIIIPRALKAAGTAEDGEGEEGEGEEEGAEAAAEA